MLSTAIEKIFVINLKHRTDRLASITKELTTLGLLDRMEVVEGTVLKAHGTGTAGISLSHMRCIQLAKERGYKYAMIFQDDMKCLVPPTEFISSLNSFLEASKDDPWHGLWFGSFYRAYVSDAEYVTPISFNQDTATLIHERAYDTIIPYLQYCTDKYVETGEERYVLDQLLNKLDPKHPVEKTFLPFKAGVRVLHKKICGQADIFSDRVFATMGGGHGLHL